MLVPPVNDGYGNFAPDFFDTQYGVAVKWSGWAVGSKRMTEQGYK